MNFVGIGLTVWGILFPGPYTALMLGLIALPWVALEVVRRSKGLIRLDEFKNEIRPHVAFALLMTPLALGLRSVLDYDMIQSWRLWIPALIVTTVLTAASFAVNADSARTKTTTIVLGFFALCYGYGATVEVNAMRDPVPETTYSAAVHGKHVLEGKQAEYRLEVGPWGPQDRDNEVEVSPAVYWAAEPGTLISISLRTGWLGAQWYIVRSR